MKKYEKLKTQYPDYISLEQLVKICKIAKRSAHYLVTNGIIPATDTGKTTWRYKIHIDDVITYLRRKEQWGNPIPRGATSQREAKRRYSYSQVVMPESGQKVAEYFKSIYADYPDVLTVADMALMTGLNEKSFRRIIAEGHIKYLMSGRKQYVPKVYFWDFISSKRFIDLWSNSDEFIKILEGYQEWSKRKILGRLGNMARGLYNNHE